MKFALVCDPSYRDNCLDGEADEEFDDGATSKFPPIQIWDANSNVAPEISGTYDLGWTVRAEHLPHGLLRFTLAFVAYEQNSIIAVLSCCKADKDGKMPVYHDPLDTKWRLTLSPDPATRCLNVQNPQKMPHWCSRCNTELVTSFRVCQTCESFSLCSHCSMRIGDRHQPDHEFKSMSFEAEDHD